MHILTVVVDTKSTISVCTKDLVVNIYTVYILKQALHLCG